MHHPIAGDEKYGNKAFNQLMKSRGLKRLFLHAVRISFTLPDAPSRIDIRAPLPSDLRSVLQTLNIHEEALL